MNDMPFITDLRRVLDEVEEMLVGKNRKYGNSVFDPINCFSKLGPIEGIRIRLDDKIKRLINQQEDDTEDTELDLLGYMIIHRIAKLRKAREEFDSLLP